MNRENYMKRNEMLTEIYKQEEPQVNIAKKYKVSEAHISQMATLFKQLKYQPKLINNNLVCFKCEIDKRPLVFHHNHISGQYIALVCNSCNRKFLDNEISYKTKEQRLHDKLHKKNQIINKMARQIVSISFPKELQKNLDDLANTLHMSKSKIIRNMFTDLKFLYEFMGLHTKMEISWDKLDSESKKKLKEISEIIQWI